MIILRNKYYSEEKKDKEPSKGLNVGVGAVIGGIGGRQLGIPLGDYLENKYLNINGVKKIIKDGKLLGHIYKTEIPNADVFDKIISNSRKIRNCVPIASIAAGTLAGAYLGKKHYDKKKKEIEEKLKNKRA